MGFWASSALGTGGAGRRSLRKNDILTMGVNQEAADERGMVAPRGQRRSRGRGRVVLVKQWV